MKAPRWAVGDRVPSPINGGKYATVVDLRWDSTSEDDYADELGDWVYLLFYDNEPNSTLDEATERGIAYYADCNV